MPEGVHVANYFAAANYGLPVLLQLSFPEMPLFPSERYQIMIGKDRASCLFRTMALSASPQQTTQLQLTQ